MPRRDIVVVGASAGGVESLVQIAKRCPKELPAALIVVLHRPAGAESNLPRILNRAGPLHAAHALDDEEIHSGRIYVAPPDTHLIVQRGRLQLWRGPTENGTRPAIDPLFRTAAQNYGSRVIGVVLSGTGDDGTAGLSAVKKWGGLAVAQDPAEALYPGMPTSAIEYVDVDHVLPLAQIPSLLVRIASESVIGVASNGRGPGEPETREETGLAGVQEIEPEQGEASGVTCPACGGALWEVREAGVPRFRCHVGHAYSLHSIAPEHDKIVERALWSSVRALEERAALLRRLGERAQRGQRPLLIKRYEAQAKDAEKNANTVRGILLRASVRRKKMPEPKPEKHPVLIGT